MPLHWLAARRKLPPRVTAQKTWMVPIRVLASLKSGVVKTKASPAENLGLRGFFAFGALSTNLKVPPDPSMI